MDRLEQFYDLFSKQIYGEEITQHFLELDRSRRRIYFKDDKIAVNQFILEYYLNLKNNENPQSCKNKKCASIFDKYFKERPFEFANWRGYLDFSKENAKDIMIIAEAAGPQISTHLNISYNLSSLPIEDNGRMNKSKIKDLLEKVKENIISQNKYNNEVINDIIPEMINNVMQHKLWEYLYNFFSDDDLLFERVLNSLYITDMVKCNLGKTSERKSNTIWKDCIENCKNYFYQENELINPKLILVMGNIVFKTFKSLLKKNKIQIQNDPTINIKNYLIDFPNRKFGYINLNKEKIYLYQIYHNSFYYYGLEKEILRPLYVKQSREFISKEIIPNVLRWNKKQ